MTEVWLVAHGTGKDQESTFVPTGCRLHFYVAEGWIFERSTGNLVVAAAGTDQPAQHLHEITAGNQVVNYRLGSLKESESENVKAVDVGASNLNIAGFQGPLGTRFPLPVRGEDGSTTVTKIEFCTSPAECDAQREKWKGRHAPSCGGLFNMLAGTYGTSVEFHGIFCRVGNAPERLMYKKFDDEHQLDDKRPRYVPNPAKALRTYVDWDALTDEQKARLEKYNARIGPIEDLSLYDQMDLYRQQLEDVAKSGSRMEYENQRKQLFRGMEATLRAANFEVPAFEPHPDPYAMHPYDTKLLDATGWNPRDIGGTATGHDPSAFHDALVDCLGDSITVEHFSAYLLSRPGENYPSYDYWVKVANKLYLTDSWADNLGALMDVNELICSPEASSASSVLVGTTAYASFTELENLLCGGTDSQPMSTKDMGPFYEAFRTDLATALTVPFMEFCSHYSYYVPACTEIEYLSCDESSDDDGYTSTW